MLRSPCFRGSLSLSRTSAASAGRLYQKTSPIVSKAAAAQPPMRASARRQFSFSGFSRGGKHNSGQQAHQHQQQQQQQQQNQRRAFSSWRDPGLQFTSVVSNPADVEGPEGVPSRAEQVRRLEQYGKGVESKIEGSNKDAVVGSAQSLAQAAVAGRDDSAEPYYDLVVIGAGATGAGIALDAASRGLKVACIERGDFGSETSSRSTKLIWAGIKYMAAATAAVMSSKLLTNPIQTVQSFRDEMHMVYECHAERRYMMTKQAHLCNWIPIAIPFTSWYISPPPLGHWLYGFFPMLAPAVLKFYDALSKFHCPPSHILRASIVEKDYPQLSMTPATTVQNIEKMDERNNKALNYVAVFYEAQHDDARTNLAIALSAAEHGAHIANYVEMTGVISDGKRVTGIQAVDRMTNKTFDIRARRVVFAGGPFTDGLRQMEYDEIKENGEEFRPAVSGGGGSHIVLPGYYCPKDMGILDVNTSDGRFMFILPWHGHTLVGTTDIKSPAETLPFAPEEEVQWLLRESSKFLSAHPRRSDVLSAWRGWRPLATDPHAPSNGGQVSRDHVLSEHPETGVLSIAGGKWTTWREMAQETVDKIVEGRQDKDKVPKCKTLDISLFGGDGYTRNLSVMLIQKYGMSQAVAEHMVGAYGGRVWEVCEYVLSVDDDSDVPPWNKKLVHTRRKKSVGSNEVDVEDARAFDFPYTHADVLWACREYACTIEDILSRRTRLAYLDRDAAMQAIPVVADLMQRQLKWTQQVKQQQIEAARVYVGSYGGREPAPEPTASSQ